MCLELVSASGVGQHSSILQQNNIHFKQILSYTGQISVNGTLLCTLKISLMGNL